VLTNGIGVSPLDVLHMAHLDIIQKTT